MGGRDFEDRPEEFDGNLMDALLETELKADEALAEANAGWIDGNDVGAFGYELYFVGSEVNSMGDALEPVFSDAPVRWTRVELRNGLEDPDPKVITVNQATAAMAPRFYRSDLAVTLAARTGRTSGVVSVSSSPAAVRGG